MPAPATFSGSSLYWVIVDEGDESAAFDADALRARSDSVISLNEVLISAGIDVADVLVASARVGVGV